MSEPRLRINRVAPIRICDNGGWTDIWFAANSQVFNIGVYPCAELRKSPGRPCTPATSTPWGAAMVENTEA
ncbi:MAG: hypothetical protein VX733_08005 [Candidatus Latescibacterota bacterium]|nr:hypothetical protein [Candidatus Latescibacterota bacterium]